MLALPSKLTPPMVRAVVNIAADEAVEAFPVNAPIKVVAVKAQYNWTGFSSPADIVRIEEILKQRPT